MSGSKLVRKCGELASEAIHLADAWSRRIALEFPDSIRLSVHPYPAHFSERIGIFLTETKEEWMTPWHGVAVYWESTNKWEIMKNYKAQELGGRLVCRADGQPDHYIIDTPSADIGKH
jgi:pyoverdine/dityrosine biosynthesis protein Dit1